MIEVKQGDCIEVLKEMEQNSIDTIYTCPSPFSYYDYTETQLIGSEKSPLKYLQNLVKIFDECNRVLKKTGNLWVQMGDQYDILGQLMGLPIYFENLMRQNGWALMDRVIWYRTETNRKPPKPEKGFIKNYEFLFHFVDDPQTFFFNEKSKYARTSVHSYPLEESYYTNEFDSGLPYQLSEMVIDTTCPPNGTVLDPLCGSGKVGVVAKKMNRNFIGIDINLETVETCRIRLGLN